MTLRNICLLILLLSIYFLEHLRVIVTYSYTSSFLWLFIAIVIWHLYRKKPLAKSKHMGLVKSWAAILAVVHITIMIMAGLVDGFGKSPYNHSFAGILYNILFVGSPLLGRELIRAHIINNSARKKGNTILLIIISIIMALTSIPLFRFTSLNSLESTVQFIAQYLAPEFAINVLASYLALLGGPVVSIIYMGLLQAFHWMSPVLPNLRWITIAVVGVLCPIFSLLVFHNSYGRETKTIKKRHEKEEGVFGWMVTSVLCIAIIWFAVGVFPVYPSVIATGSMQPMIDPGDMILVEKISDIEGINNLNEGDVIQFSRGGILITHRIKDIVYEDNGLMSFKTKGDNNSVPDQELVKPEHVRGKIVRVIPKVGWPTLLLKQSNDVPLDDIEF